MTAGQFSYFLGALALSLGCSRLAKWIAGALDAEVEGRFGIALAACFIPSAIPLLAQGAFAFTDVLAMLASMLAAGVTSWGFRQGQSPVAGMKQPGGRHG